MQVSNTIKKTGGCDCARYKKYKNEIKQSLKDNIKTCDKCIKCLHPCQLWSFTVSVYSIVENCGISSAGWCCSLIAAYCGGNYKIQPYVIVNCVHMTAFTAQSDIYFAYM